MRDVDFSEIYKLYAKRLYLFIYNKCRDTELAEDVVQTAFLKAIQNIDGFQGDSSIYSWITKIALNVLFEEWKKSSTQNVSLEEITSDGSELSATDSDILENLIKNEERSELYARISLLDENQQEIVKLRLQEVSFKKTGEIFGRNENWAKSNYHRAVKKLKEME